MYTVMFLIASGGLFFIVDSSRRAAEEKVLEAIVKEARERAKKAEKEIDRATSPKTES